MKKINKILAIGGLIIASSLFSCTQFDEININPDTTTHVSASMLCTGIILQFANFNGQDSKAFLTQDALPKYIGYANDGQLNEQYNLIGSSSFGAMTILTNIDQMLNTAKGSVMESSYQGVAEFAKAYIFYKLTMEMGDIPFSEAVA